MNPPFGYTSAVPETGSSADDSAYEMASEIRQHQELESFDRSSAAQQYGLKESAVHARAARFHASYPRHQMLAHVDGHPQAMTSAVDETSSSQDSAANSWASAVFQQSLNSQRQGRHQFRSSQPVQLRNVQRPARRQFLVQNPGYKPANLHLGQSSSIREAPAGHEERAWGWAVNALKHRRDAAQHPRAISTPPVMAQAMAQPAPRDTKIERMYKLKVARQAVLDVHRTTQVGESADFAEDQRKAQLRESEVRSICFAFLPLTPADFLQRHRSRSKPIVRRNWQTRVPRCESENFVASNCLNSRLLHRPAHLRSLSLVFFFHSSILFPPLSTMCSMACLIPLHRSQPALPFVPHLMRRRAAAHTQAEAQEYDRVFQ
jgi:hypothetical protein